MSNPYPGRRGGQSSQTFGPTYRFVSLRGERFEKSIKAELDGEKAKEAIRSVSLPSVKFLASEKVKA